MSAAHVLSTAIPFQIEIVKGPHAGQTFSLSKSVITVGRGSENDIVLSEDPKVSRHHAEILFSDKGVTIKNLSQKNFVVFRGQKVHTETLAFGDRVFIGDSELHFLIPETGLKAQARIQAQTQVAKSAAPVDVNNQNTVIAVRAAPAPVPVSVKMNFPANNGMMPPPIQRGGPLPQRPAPQPEKTNRLRFYIIVGAVMIGLYLFLSSGSKKKVEEIRFGPSEAIQRELLQADETKRSLEDEKRKNESLQNRRARENFTKGFRDYMQGQYARAKETFQVVLTLDPNHVEGRRYLTLSKLKFDQQVKNYMQQGRINFENKNYRLCKSHFLNAMTMLNQQTNDPTYQEAKKLYDLCDLSQGGR